EAVPFGLDSRFLGTNVGPHSIYLSTAVDLGIVGICVFLAWMASLVLRIQRSGIYLVAIRATFVAYLVQGAYLDILNRKYFWLFLGLAEGCRWLFNAWDEVRHSAATTRVVADKPLSQSS